MLNGGVDASYDSVASAETLEVGVRVAAPRSRIVLTGVARPRRFEWTPVYFKEIALVGSNAFGLETFGERRQHAMEWYLEWLQTRGLDATATLTHRFALEDWPRALLVCFDQARSGAVEVLFDFRGGQGTSGA
jgi:threonine dehydrogenase-like Zn-dependent dehydrogenase